MPEWALFIVFAGGAAVFAVAGLAAVHRWLGSWRTEPSSGTVTGVAQMVMTLFALVLAFAVVSLDGSYTGANDNVRSEANSLSGIVGDMRVFPEADQRAVAAAAGAYIHEVRVQEFPAMRDGNLDQRGQDLLDRLFTTVETITPTTHVQRGFYASAIASLNELATQRRDRLAASDSALPVAFWVLILLTAFASLAMTILIKAHSFALEVAMVTAVAVVIGVGLLTTLLLEYPFSGSIAVSSSPFVEGSLAQLPGAR
jgi:hypothetical protein